LIWPANSRRSLIFGNVYQLLENQTRLKWELFFPGVHIHWLYREANNGPAAAFIQFQPGARVPSHEHQGFEHIFVLRGSQTDENGMLRSGGLMVHAPGTSHSIFSEEGCLVLAIYEKRGKFTSNATGDPSEKISELKGQIENNSDSPPASESPPACVSLAVNGTLMRGLELNPNLLSAGAKFICETETEPAYRLWSINGRHPAMIRVKEGGVAVAVEVWSVPCQGIYSILQQEPAGLSIGKVKLADGSQVLGVLGEPALCEGQEEISQYGGWRAYLRANREL
jgi:quercetin dioxygenase-like cupin family protein